MIRFILLFAAFIAGVPCFAQSDLATFNLTNGVTKCYGTIYDDPNPGASVELIFNDEGTLLFIGGQDVADTSNYEVKRDGSGRIASIGYLEGDSFNTAEFAYDANGRVSAIRTTWLNLDTDAEGVVSDARLMWDGEGNLYRMDITDDEGNRVSHTYEYTSRDEKGNWIVRIHEDSNGNQCQESRAISYAADAASDVAAASAAGAGAAVDSGYDDAINRAVATRQARSNRIGNKLQNIIGLILILCMCAHCIYVYFFRNLKPHSAEDFGAMRTTGGRNEAMTDDEIAEFDALIQEIDTRYLDKVKFGDETGLVPTKYKQMQAIRRVLLRMEEIAPTRRGEVDEYNRLVEQYNEWNKRSFTGNKLYLGIVAVIGVCLCFAGMFFEGGLAMLLGAPFYYLASSRPFFMMLGREIKGKSAYGSNMVGRVLVGVLGFWSAAAGEKYYKRHVYADGDKGSWERDYSEELGSFSMKTILVGCVLLVLLFAIWIVNIVNYLRNYVLYK